MRFAVFVLLCAVFASTVPSAGAYYDPNRPQTVVAVHTLDGSVVLAWNPVPGAAGYIIYRGLDPKAMEPIATTDTVFYEDVDPPNAAPIFYGVKALHAAENVEPTVVMVQSECIGIGRNLSVTLTIQNCIKW